MSAFDRAGDGRQVEVSVANTLQSSCGPGQAEPIA